MAEVRLAEVRQIEQAALVHELGKPATSKTRAAFRSVLLIARRLL
jgi:hypothetical protein